MGVGSYDRDVKESSLNSTPTLERQSTGWYNRQNKFKLVKMIQPMIEMGTSCV